MQLEAIDHIMRDVLGLLLGHLGSHDGCMFVELFGVAADDLSSQMFGEFHTQFSLADCSRPNDENPIHLVVMLHKYKRKLNVQISLQFNTTKI